MATYPTVAQMKSIDALRSRFAELDLEIPSDDAILTAAEESPLAQPIQIGSFTVGNRWCIHPMEGWDANADGSPSEFTLRRWHHFGVSGAKLIWGGEAAAVRPDGRANPRQTMAIAENKDGLAKLLDTLMSAHRNACGTTDDLLVGLQLTHSGRFCRPIGKALEPKIAYHHPLLDAKFGIDANDDSVVWTDDELFELIQQYVAAARLAADVGFRFVDVKACHGYLLHEFLSATQRPGPFGGDFTGRTRLLKTIIQEIQAAVPDIMILVRLSAFDMLPFQTSLEVGRPMDWPADQPYLFGFGVDANQPLQMDLTEPVQLLKDLEDAGVASVNLSCGSPYYNPHAQRPASFPPSDGYLPPEDPLIGVARQIHAARQCKQAVPNLPLVGTGYSYLQDYLPHVCQALVRSGWIDVVGLGRMVLSYPELPADTLSTGSMQRKRICRTFSDCTTAPRNGIVSGCFPLDPFYKEMDEAQTLKEIKKSIKS